MSMSNYPTDNDSEYGDYDADNTYDDPQADLEGDPSDDLGDTQVRGVPPSRRRMPPDDLPPEYTRPAVPYADDAPVARPSSRPVPRPAQRVARPGEAPPRRAPDPAEWSDRLPPQSPVPPRGYSQPAAPSRSQSAPRRSDRRPARQPVDKRNSGLYLPWWSLIIMMMFVGGVAVGAWVILAQSGGNVTPGGGTPQVIVITATYTIGAPPSITPIQFAASVTPTSPLPTIAASLTLPAGTFQIGSTVRVVGTGIGGLNVRSAPGLDSIVKFQAPDGTLFVLREGPTLASNEEWWRIEDPNDPTSGGWASRRFLEGIAQ